MDGQLVFDDETPTPALLSQHPPEVVTRRLALTKTPTKDAERVARLHDNL